MIAVLSLIIGVAAAFSLLQWGIVVIGEYIKLPSNLVPIVSFFLIFLAVIIGLNFLGKIAKKAIDLTLVGSLDNVAGALVGILKSAFVISVLIWIFSSIGVVFFSEFIEESQLYSYIQPVAPAIFEYLSFVMPFLKDLYQSVQEQLQPQSV